jgi:hypothetical protein
VADLEGFQRFQLKPHLCLILRDRCTIVLGLSKDQEKLVDFLGLFFLEKLLRDLLWLTLTVLDQKRIDRPSDLPVSSWRSPGMGVV